MSPRVFAGLALWLSLAALPALHLGLRPLEWVVVATPLCLLPLGGAAVAFLVSLLPLFVLRPDLASPQAQGTPGILAQSALVVVYLIIALADGPRRQGRTSWRGAWDLGRGMAAVAAVILAATLTAPYLPGVADALRGSYPSGVAACAALVAAGSLALGVGVVLVYLAAPLEEAARRRP